MKVVTHPAEVTYDIIGLSEAQARYLRNLLGRQNGQTKDALGVGRGDWQAMSDIYNALADAVDDE